MTIQNLNIQLNELLKSYIKERGHYASGRLYNSINFQCTYIDSAFDIKLSSVEYINYLDDGQFLNKFYSKPEVESIFVSFLESELIKILQF